MFGRIQETGWKYSLAILFNRIVPRVLFRCRRFVIFETQGPTTSGEVPRQLPAGFSVSWAESESTVTAAESLTGFHRTMSAGKHRAAIVTHAGTIIAALWCTELQFDESELGVTMDLAEDQRWLFSGYVDPEYRKRGIYRHLFEFVTGTCGTDHQYLLAINPDNRRSMSAHQSPGLRPVGRVFCLRCLRIVYCSGRGQVSSNRRWSINFTKRPVRLQVGTCSDGDTDDSAARR